MSGPVPAAAIDGLIRDCMGAVGLPPHDAARVAELMLEADLTGADAHGVFRLPQYVRRIKGGAVNPAPRITVEKTGAATAMVDGDNGMGHLVMSRAAETAIELAKEAGVAWVGARRSNHAGAAGVYAAMALRQDMVGIYSVVANANHMPVWGSSENLLGTNPVAFAIPAGEEPPVVLDIATTVVSYGTVKANRMQGKPMPPGWMIDKQGRPLTDSAKSADGLLRPIGGHKGSGLALVLGLLAGTLNGAAFGRDVVDFNYDDETACDTGHFIVALDVGRFLPLPAFKAAVDRHLRDLKSSPKLPGVDAIRLPGEQRATRRADRARNGVPVYPEMVELLDKLAGELKVKPLPAFKAAVDRHLRDLKSSPKLPGVDAIRLPGEQRATRRAERARNGVPVYPEVIELLDKLAGELKVKPLRAR